MKLSSLSARVGQTFALLALAFAGTAAAQSLRPYKIFAAGTAVNATGPDSITIGNGSVWVAYTNGADSTGLFGTSTVVQYDMEGVIRHQYSIAGYVDGLKIDPGTGVVWALQNQDGNSTLTLIDPKKGILTNPPLSYAVPSSTQGYDDVVFQGNQIFMSHTNPVNPTDAAIVLLDNRTSPLVVSTVLTAGATGTNLATGQKNQVTTDHDPDSLKSTPDGGLMLTSGDDGQLIFVKNPGKPDQSVSFLTLLDPVGGLAVSGLDDALFVTSGEGTFYLTDTNNNRVLSVEAEDLPFNSLYANIGSLNEFAKIDQKTGQASALIPNLAAPHGLVFIPSEQGNQDNQ